MKRGAIVAAMLLVGGVAVADGRGGAAVEVEVGKTRELNVGYMRGLICDDLSVVDAQLTTRVVHGAETNVLILTGKTIGETACRVGSLSVPPYQLFDVHVVAAK